MKLGNKIVDWIDDLVYNIKHIKGNIHSFFNFLGRWFSYYKVLRKAYDFDYISILDVERYQLTRILNTITKYHNYEDWERDIYWMNKALELLDIIDKKGGVELNGRGFKLEPCGNGFYKIVENQESKWVMPFYVNISNYKRFLPTIGKKELENSRIEPLIKGCLREEKAWKLYHKLRMYKMRNWWL